MVKIGIFDSGVGGLTVVREVKRLLPQVSVIYFGDTARTPYGIKSRKTLIRYAVEDARFLLSKGADIIIIACHSAASTASWELKARLDVPVFEVVSPSVVQACRLTRKGRIGVIGTRATVSSGVYPRLIPEERMGTEVFQQACPLLVPLVEEGWLDRRETRMIVKRYLRPLKLRQIDTLVLGCTHYPLLRRVIEEKAGRRIKIVDPSEEVAKSVKAYLEQERLLDEGRSAQEAGPPPVDMDRYFVSDLAPHTSQIVRNFMGRPVRLEEVLL